MRRLLFLILPDTAVRTLTQRKLAVSNLAQDATTGREIF